MCGALLMMKAKRNFYQDMKIRVINVASTVIDSTLECICISNITIVKLHLLFDIDISSRLKSTISKFLNKIVVK